MSSQNLLQIDTRYRCQCESILNIVSGDVPRILTIVPTKAQYKAICNDIKKKAWRSKDNINNAIRAFDILAGAVHKHIVYAKDQIVQAALAGDESELIQMKRIDRLKLALHVMKHIGLQQVSLKKRLHTLLIEKELKEKDYSRWNIGGGD